MDLFKQPGVAETIDWAHALTQLDCMVLDPDTKTTHGTLLKYQDDIEKIRGSEASRILADIKGEMLMTEPRDTHKRRRRLIAANIAFRARLASGRPTIRPGNKLSPHKNCFGVGDRTKRRLLLDAPCRVCEQTRST